MTPEGRLRRKISDSLAQQELHYGGRLTYWSIADSYLVGMPDMMVCLDGHLFALELKAANGRLEPIQNFVLRRYDRAGATAGVIRAHEEAPMGFVFERVNRKLGILDPIVPGVHLWLEAIKSQDEPPVSAPSTRL